MQYLKKIKAEPHLLDPVPEYLFFRHVLGGGSSLSREKNSPADVIIDRVSKNRKLPDTCAASWIDLQRIS